MKDLVVSNKDLLVSAYSQQSDVSQNNTARFVYVEFFKRTGFSTSCFVLIHACTSSSDFCNELTGYWLFQ